MDINEDNIKYAARLCNVLSSEEAIDLLVAEKGAHPDVAYLLVVAGNQLNASREEGKQ